MNRRRTERTPSSGPVVIKSLDPGLYFAERCAMVDVSTCGCQLRAPRPFINGTWISLHLKSSHRPIAARVVRSIPAESDSWSIGLELYRSEQSWG